MVLYIENTNVKKEKSIRPLFHTMVKNKSKKYKDNIGFYIDFSYSDGSKYLNLETKTPKIFFNFNWLNYVDCKINKYLFITMNSFNPNKSITPKMTEERFTYLLNFFKYKSEYKKNINGDIVILLNNLKRGYFTNDLKTNNIYKYLTKLINKIRTFTNRRIYIRFHPKDILKGYDNEIFNKLDNKLNIYMDKNIDIISVLTNSYCVFIQNSKVIFDFVNYGIPLFNLDLIKYNYFDNIYNNIEDIDNIDKITQINRLDFLKKYYPHIYTYDDWIKDDFIETVLSNYSLNTLE